VVIALLALLGVDLIILLGPYREPAYATTAGREQV
jgi:hypothetical protein